MTILLNVLIRLAIATLAFPTLAFAEAHTPADGIILVVESHDAGDGSVTQTDFDLDMLDALPQEVFETSTIWTEGVMEFSGPPLSAVLEMLEAEAGSVTAFALNDYNVALEPDTIFQSFPIIATRINGQPFSVREKGPLWLVYPYDSSKTYRTEVIYSQSIWQLDRLRLEVP